MRENDSIDPAMAGPAGPIVEPLLRALEAEFALVLGRCERVEESCAALAEILATADEEAAARCHHRLLPLLRRRQGAPAAALAAFLESRAERGSSAGPIVQGLLAARDDGVRRRGLELLRRLVETGRLPVEPALALAAAEAIAEDATAGADPATRAFLRELLGRMPAARDLPAGAEALVALLSPEQALPLRRLAARILDETGAPAPADRWTAVLGDAAAEVLRPHLQYTRATHADLVELTAEPGILDAALDSFREAERTLGADLLGMIIGELGWGRVAGGLTCRRWVGVSVQGGPPLAVTPVEAAWLGSCIGARRLWERFLVVARGGTGAPAGGRPGGAGTGLDEDGAVRRFRGYNVAHAELLGLILEVAPLTPARVEEILARMDRVVADFAALFREHSDDAARVAGIYARLRSESLAAIAGLPPDRPLAGEATRLVQMFEDPATLDEVRTVHGLKRYLHQQGLRLAFKVFRSGRSANRTVDLVLAAPHRVLHVVRRIRYIDFEPDPAAEAPDLPFAVALLVEALGRRLLMEKPDWPDAEVLVYGNEVQAFIRFRNHPVFLRLDLSPPQRGGMIDLEYFGVSQYELDRHPDLGLPWIQRVFRRLDFEVQAEGQRLHARYDKERAFDLGDLTARARRLCALLPHLMELDWVIGRLDYPAPAREAIADAWTDRLVDWGWLPIAECLTADRTRILRGLVPDPAGERELPWDGRNGYRDRFTPAAPATETAGLWERLRQGARSRGLDAHARWEQMAGRPFSPLPLEAALLEPFREALARGELRAIAGGQELVASGLDRRAHEAELPARLLADGGPPLAAAVRVAFVVRSIERHLRFRDVGAVQRHPVQRASLFLRGERVELVVLRDANGIARLAIAFDVPLQLGPGSPPLTLSRAERTLDDRELIRRLRRDNYLAVGSEPPREAEDPETLRALFAVPAPVSRPSPAPGERMVPGIVASPGLAAGFARLAAEGRSPEDVDHAVLVAPAIRPEDTGLIRRAAALVSTGGGVLSHAGLIALEMRKPALVVEGRWRRDATGRQILTYRFLDYREEATRVGPYEVTQRLDLQEREDELREGDLLVVDAEAGLLSVLGQDREALALQEEIRRLQDAAEGLRRAGPDEALAARGRWLRAAHALGRVLARIDRFALARHAVRALLLGVGTPPTAACRHDVGRLLRELLQNPRCGPAAAQTARELRAELQRRHRALERAALRDLPSASGPAEILQLRRGVRQVAHALQSVEAGLARAGFDEGTSESRPAVDESARRRLLELRRERAAALVQAATEPDARWRARHLLEQVRSLDAILGPDEDGARDEERRRQIESELIRWERDRRRELSGRYVIFGGEGGRELAPLIGAKGANLGEVARILGPGKVPAWFAVTDLAFRSILEGPPGPAAGALGLRAERGSLAAAIDEILARAETEPRRQAAAIRQLWQSAPLPRDLEAALLEAYRALGADRPAPTSELEGGPFVAIRSSAFEEDTVAASWAGQFDTFLFIQGEEALLHHLKLALASLWTERALQYGELTGRPADRRGGGVLVQRIVHARASGVLHTRSAAAGQLREMIINAALGLGEGVVSGTVEVDHIVVSREDPDLADPLRFRYQVGDKSSRVVFDRRTGSGTRREETLYHQRLRAALEYADLAELVRAAARLEEIYGYPLDVEFAFEDDALNILQVRPIVTFQDAWRETTERFPLAVERGHAQEDTPR